MFCPLIDAPPAHPDKTLTTMEYMQTFMIDMRMDHVQLCMDMQLFAVTKQVSWHHLDRIKNVVAHPIWMYIIQLFLSCMGKLMKSSALECYVGAAYGGLTGICNGKIDESNA